MGDDYLFHGDGDDEFGSLAPAARRRGAPAAPDGLTSYVSPLVLRVLLLRPGPALRRCEGAGGHERRRLRTRRRAGMDSPVAHNNQQTPDARRVSLCGQPAPLRRRAERPPPRDARPRDQQRSSRACRPACSAILRRFFNARWSRVTPPFLPLQR